MPTPCTFTSAASAISRGVACGRDVLEVAAAAQRGVHGVGDQPAVAPAEVLVLAEELAQGHVRGLARGQDDGEGLDDGLQLGLSDQQGGT